jgi:hypothetical protein
MVKVGKYMNLIFITRSRISYLSKVKSWINSIHLFKSVYHLMTGLSKSTNTNTPPMSSHPNKNVADIMIVEIEYSIFMAI